jgi:hypothetical protein
MNGTLEDTTDDGFENLLIDLHFEVTLLGQSGTDE